MREWFKTGSGVDLNGILEEESNTEYGEEIIFEDVMVENFSRL